MVDGILLELGLIDVKLLHNLLKLTVDDLLLFLGHPDHELLVTLFIINQVASVLYILSLFL